MSQKKNGVMQGVRIKGKKPINLHYNFIMALQTQGETMGECLTILSGEHRKVLGARLGR